MTFSKAGIDIRHVDSPETNWFSASRLVLLLTTETQFTKQGANGSIVKMIGT